jgi:hypothetical protein
VITLAFLALWPTFHGMSGGKFPCPEYVREHVSEKARRRTRPARRPASRLHGRRRRAIRDKRNNYYEDMRLELTRIYGLLKEDERATEETYKNSRKVELEAPRTAADTITLNSSRAWTRRRSTTASSSVSAPRSR